MFHVNPLLGTYVQAEITDIDLRTYPNFKALNVAYLELYHLSLHVLNFLIRLRRCRPVSMDVNLASALTLYNKASITTAADDNLKYFFTVFQRK